MSEPRKLNTHGASGGQTPALSEQEQYAAAHRTVRRPGQAAQPRTVRTDGHSAAQSTQPAQQSARRTVRRTPAQQTSAAPAQKPLTHAQKQAMAYRAAAERKYGDTVRFSYTPHHNSSAEESSDAPRRTARQSADRRTARDAYRARDYGRELPSGEGIRPDFSAAPARTPQKTVHRAAHSAQGTKHKHKKQDAPAHGGKGKKPKKRRWWKILLVTLCVICLIFGGTYAFIVAAIAPELGSVKLDQLLNTPKEFQDDEFNFVVVGIDRSTQKEGDTTNDAEVADGNTDMILYVHFNNVTGELKMLQIPRDTMVSTDRSVSANYRINNVAKTQATESGTMNIAALCEQLADMYQIPIDGYMTIRLEMLVELVDLFGGIELYVPQTMDYAGSHLDEGYQTLDGNAVEFLLRTRKIYSDGDIGRLNMQRQFYSALFRRLKSIGNIWDVAKLTPAVLNYMETDISVSKLVSFAVSMLKIDSSNIMICQMPVKSGPLYNEQSVLYAARQEDADLLNTYFRENTGTVDASALQLCDSVSELGFDLSGYTATDPNIQYMGTLNDEAAAAQQNNNLDDSHQVEYVDSDSTSDSTSDSDSAA